MTPEPDRELSIIVPVYNTAATLERCVHSITAQSLTDLEVWLVDDGSTDGSAQLCDRLAAQNPAIHVLHVPHGGLSRARNHALCHAVGRFVTFVDSDDFVSTDLYRPIIDAMSIDVDIAEYSIYRHYLSPRAALHTFDYHIYDTAQDYWYNTQGYTHTYAWNKVYRRALFDGISYPPDTVFEDAHTTPLLLRRARRIMTLPHGIYYYCENPHGITAQAGGAQLQSLLQAHLSHWSDLSHRDFYLHLLNIQLDVCRMLHTAPILPARRIRPLKGLPLKTKIKALSVQWLGMERTCRLFSLLRGSKKRKK